MPQRSLSLAFLSSKAVKSGTSWTARLDDGIEARVSVPGVAADRTLAARAAFLDGVNPVARVSVAVDDGGAISRSRQSYTLPGRELAASVDEAAALISAAEREKATVKPVNRLPEAVKVEAAVGNGKAK